MALEVAGLCPMPALAQLLSGPRPVVLPVFLVPLKGGMM